MFDIGVDVCIYVCVYIPMFAYFTLCHSNECNRLQFNNNRIKFKMKTKCKEKAKIDLFSAFGMAIHYYGGGESSEKRYSTCTLFSWNSKIETLEDWERYSCNMFVGWRVGSGFVHSPNNQQAININSACKAHKLTILRFE